jgi:hypothetical protein
MKDLYKRLGLDDAAPADAIRAALAGPAAAPAAAPTAAPLPLDAATRTAAEFVLLDPRRRAVYDRNRRVLVTIGQLRARLGLNLKPFWSRGGFGDFSYPFDPAGGHTGAGAAAHPPQDPLADPRMLWRAFGRAGRRRQSAHGQVARGPSRLGLWLAAAAVLALCIVAALFALRDWR